MVWIFVNQEDAIILNKSSVDRGLFQITAYKTMTASEKTLNTNERVVFANPIKMRNEGKYVTGNKHANYTLLGDDGIIKEESYVPRGQEAVVLGMVHVRDKLKEVKNGVFTEYVKEEMYHDVSLRTDVHHYGKVDRVFVATQNQGTPSKIAKVRFRKVRRPELGDKACLTPDHDVLTSKGWKPIAEITKKDEVYVLKADGSFGYENPVDLIVKDCKEEMLYDLHSQQVDLCVTQDHAMWVKKRGKTTYERIPAKEIVGKRVAYAKSAMNSNDDYQIILPATNKCEPIHLDMDAFLEFFGYWIGEGWARIVKRTRPGRKTETTDYTVEVVACKQDDKDRVTHLVKKLGFSPTRHGENSIQIASRQLAEFFAPLSVGAPHKYLPDWTWKLSQRQAQKMYEGMRRGDGSIKQSGSDVYYTSSIRLANDVQRLALHAGWSANISINKPKGTTTFIKGRTVTSKYNNYVVKIVKSKNNPTVNHGHAKTQNGQKEQLIPYTGKVYCFEVPSHVFYCRRNGKPVWIGNCSSHGQKGVFGMILPQHDMPYTKDGIVPDLIINPHAFPSRMTIGHLVETVTAKLCCLEGCYGDGTVFLPFDTEKVYSQLEENGYERHGNEILYNGRTGEQIETEIFMGPIFYYRLKHMVSDKVHARGDGPRTQLTHQPTSGRSKKGGLRVGEMERDVLLAHGLAQFTKEHMMEKSDKYRWAVCRHCGVIAKYNPKSFMECMSCEGNDISIIETPYAFKLLVQEMEAMGVQMRIGHTSPMLANEESEEDSESEDLADEMAGGDPSNEYGEETETESDAETENNDETRMQTEENEQQDMDPEQTPIQQEDQQDMESDDPPEQDIAEMNMEGYDDQSTDAQSESEIEEPQDVGILQDSTDMLAPMQAADPVENSSPQDGGDEAPKDNSNDVKVIFIGEPSTMKGAGNIIEDDITNIMGNLNGIQDKYSGMMGAMKTPTRGNIDIMESSTQIDVDDPMERKFWGLDG